MTIVEVGACDPSFPTTERSEECDERDEERAHVCTERGTSQGERATEAPQRERGVGVEELELANAGQELGGAEQDELGRLPEDGWGRERTIKERNCQVIMRESGSQFAITAHVPI